MKMPTVVGIFIFTSRENFMLSWVEYEKKFDNLGIAINSKISMDRLHVPA